MVDGDPPVGGAQGAEYPLDVVLHGRDRDAERRGDEVIGLVLREELQHGELPG